MGKYIFSYTMVIAGCLALAAFFIVLDTLQVADTIAIQLAAVLLLFLMPMIAVGLFFLSFHILFLS